MDKKKIVIFAIIAIVVVVGLALVSLSLFSQTVRVSGVKFNIPEGFNFTEYGKDNKYVVLSNSQYNISIRTESGFVSDNLISVSEIKKSLEQEPEIINGENSNVSKYTNFKVAYYPLDARTGNINKVIDTYTAYMFNKSGKSFIILVEGSGTNMDELVKEIIS
ncbi:MAG: hypothetical protein FWH29_10775 [Methanobrevibacter sp.]|nr:hypothetical protein [Methanobrevibacter sp.]